MNRKNSLNRHYSDLRLPLVLLGPVISEKSTLLSDQLGHAAFRIMPDATKADVKAAIEMMFQSKGVTVDSVNIVNVKPKTKRYQGRPGRTKSWKKAYICLSKGSELNFAEIA